MAYLKENLRLGGSLSLILQSKSRHPFGILVGVWLKVRTVGIKPDIALLSQHRPTQFPGGSPKLWDRTPTVVIVR